MRRLVLAALAATLVAGGAAALPPPTSFEVARLVSKLGSDSFPEREAATKALVATGERALPAVQEAARAAKDPEVRRRASRVLELLAESFHAAEAKRLCGRWRTVGIEREGQRQPYLGTWSLVLEQEQFRWEINRGEVVHAGVYRIGYSGAINFQRTDSRSASQALYRLEGDTLLLGSADGRPRPESFETRKRTATVVLTLKRQP